MVAHAVLWYQVTATVCNVLSLLVLCIVLYKRRAGGANPAYQILRPFEAFLPAYFKERRAASERHVSRLLSSAICAAYVAACLPQALGPFADAGPDAACRAVGAFSQAASLVVVVLHGFVAPRLAHAVVVGGRRDAAVRALGRSVPAVVAASAAAAAAIGAADPRAYGLATCWCWYRGARGGARPRQRAYGFFSFYLFALAGALYSCWVLARVLRALRKHRLSMPSAGRPTLSRAATIVVEAEASRGDVARRLVANMLVFVVVWAVAFLARLVLQLDPNARGPREFALVLTLEVAVSLQGFCYGVLCLSSDDALRRLEDATIGAARAAAARRSAARRRLRRMSSLGPAARHPWAELAATPRTPRRTFSRLSSLSMSRRRLTRARSGDVEAPAATPAAALDRDVHVATLNCAERGTLAELVGGGDVGAALEDLAPPGADVYCVGVQECNCWPELVAAVGAALGAGFAELGRAQLGSAHLKGVIGVVVFARADDVAAGFVAAEARAAVPLGADLGGGRRASNKGAACVRARVGAASCAFVGCHLPADARGKSRRRERAAVAAAALVGAGAAPGRGPPDPPTHVFMFGDLNYRAVPPDLSHPTGTLARVDAAMKDARRWPAALRDDELAADVAAGLVLAGFAELGGGPRFPPTFKRDGTGYAFLKDDSGDLDAALGLARDDAAAGATPAAAAAAREIRYPSWTDRVLFASVGAAAAARLSPMRYGAGSRVTGSDHRPVALACRLAAEPAAARAFAAAAACSPSSELRAAGFGARVVAVAGCGVDWRCPGGGGADDGAPAVAAATLTFPLPSEDPFRAARRIDAVAGLLDGGGGPRARALAVEREAARAAWGAPLAARADLVHGALARHALLALEASDGAPLGSAVLALPDAGAATVAAPLTLGGRAVGALTAVVTVSVSSSARRASI